MESFGYKLKIERVKKRLTLEQLAQKLNVTRQAISMWEKNNRIPSDLMFRKIENVLKLPNGFFDADYQEMPENTIPVLGYATAGLLTEQYEQDLGYLEVPKKYTDTLKYMCVKVSGDSMDKYLQDGSYAIFNKLASYYNNQIVLVEVNRETTIKRFTENGNHIILFPQSNNPEHLPIFVEKNKIEDFKIYGVLVYSCYEW